MLYYDRSRLLLPVFSIALAGAVVLLLQPVSCLRILKEVKGRPKRQYVREGDINIGFLLGINAYSPDSFCGEEITHPMFVQSPEGAAYAIERINRNRSLLPNFDLGFAILDDCNKRVTAVSQALRFLPTVVWSENDDTDSRSRKRDAATCARIDTATAVRESDHFDVVGVVGTSRSESSIAVSYLLGMKRVPLVSYMATSEALDDKVSHPYFLRIVPSEQFQMRAILEFIVRQGWNYFSVLYSLEAYGRRANRLLQLYAKNKSVCVALEQPLDALANASEYKRIVQKLLSFKRARVVVLISDGIVMTKVVWAVHELKADNKLIWIGSDGWADELGMVPSDHYRNLVGSFVPGFPVQKATPFHSYFKRLNASSSKNPWFRESWERQSGCSFKNNSCDTSQDITKTKTFRYIDRIQYIIDCVYLYAHALHQLWSDRCPTLRGREVRKCVTGDLLLEYLKNASFEGLTGHISFDKTGIISRNVYRMYQIRIEKDRLVQVHVRDINASAPVEMIVKRPIDWSNVRDVPSDFGPNARFLPNKYTPLEDDPPPPRSVCSSLCALGEMMVYTNQKCCWECRKCRKNDRLNKDMTACEECPRLQWPDAASNNTKCAAIVPYHPSLSEPFVLAIVLASCIGVLVTIATMVLYRRRSNSPLIKACNRTLSFLQLSAILLGYASVFAYQLQPSPWSCSITYFTLCLTFTSLYSPMLVKVIRIYRLWIYVGKSLTPLKAVSPVAQVLTSCAIMNLQMILCAIVMVNSPPRRLITQHARTEKYTEVSCDFTVPGAVFFLSFNLAIIVLCCVFAFNTRKLSASFSESKLIYTCVCTTLLIGISFTPTYMTAQHEYLKSVYLSLALLLNHSVALVVLFLTRLYSIYRHSGED